MCHISVSRVDTAYQRERKETPGRERLPSEREIDVLSRWIAVDLDRDATLRGRLATRGCDAIRGGSAVAFRRGVLAIPVSWTELARRTWRGSVDDDVPGLAAQLSYFFFLALFPAILFLLAWCCSGFTSQALPS